MHKSKKTSKIRQCWTRFCDWRSRVRERQRTGNADEIFVQYGGIFFGFCLCERVPVQVVVSSLHDELAGWCAAPIEYSRAFLHTDLPLLPLHPDGVRASAFGLDSLYKRLGGFFRTFSAHTAIHLAL